MYTQRSFQLTKESANANTKWFVIDATDKVVGRLASEIAKILTGKHRPSFTPTTESGDFVIVTNCEKVKFTGKKWDEKIYHWHTNHIGGIKQRTAKEQLAKHPEKIVYDAVQGMLAKSTLGRKHLTKLRVFQGEAHTHEAQKPENYEVKI
ncbi:MAG: 50S ribosomal protein L13 [Bacteriovoracaceae bacterium]|nr:50S ribosomal protein L13 [Bacteriovoracaceae bacterium]